MTLESHCLVMETYDGATVMSGHIGRVQTILQQDYPFAYFFIVLHIDQTWYYPYQHHPSPL